MSNVSHYREISNEREEEFFQKGYNKRCFFQHNIFYIPKCGPDGLKLSHRMCGENDPNKLWEVVLYATGPEMNELPKELFFDDNIIWHQQQFGKAGQVATANLVADGNRLYTMVHISDLVQRISRRRQYKTKIENWFKGWPHMLLNSIMNFAAENGMEKIYTPTADLAREHTDPSRTVQRELFERVYDRVVGKHLLAKKVGKWWEIDVAQNIERIIIPEKKEEFIESEKTICLCHDIERGLGHINVDPDFAEAANETSLGGVDEMLRIEKETGVKATYNVVGCFLNEVRGRIEGDGHCISFHSYDHINCGEQLDKCRQIDYRIKGYRAPQSIITSDLSDKNLCHHNFEWLASSAYSFGITSPEMENRIVKIPVLFDDFELYECKLAYGDWEKKAIETIKQHEFVAFSLHDCYADYWLLHYREFLKKVRDMGKFKTLNEVADRVFLNSSK